MQHTPTKAPSPFKSRDLAPSQDSPATKGSVLSRSTASPSGAYGIAPVQAQMAPQSVIQTKPSTEVPDLDESVVNAINAALGSGDKAKALSLLLEALAAKDPVKYDKAKLVGGKLHTTSGSSLTQRGPKFQAWLEEMLKKGPANIKTGDKAMQAYLDSLTPPADKVDIKVSIGNGFFNNVSHLYSTVMHEFIHVDQLRANPMKAIMTSEWPAGFDKPSHGTEIGLREFEAYSWEEANLAQTGMDKHPDEMWNLFEQLRSHGPLSSDAAASAKWKASLENLFKLSFGLYLSAAEALMKQAAAKPLDKTQEAQLEQQYLQMKDLWGFEHQFPATSALFKARYEVVAKYFKDKADQKAAADFPAALKKAETAIQAASSDYDAYNVWNPLFQKWKALPAAAQQQHLAATKKLLPAIWEKSFDMLEKKLAAIFKADKMDRNVVPIWNTLSELVYEAQDSLVEDAALKPRKTLLADWKTKIQNR